MKALNSTFIVLIPKIKYAKDFGDFKLISLIGCLYKLTVKVLTRRLSRVLGEIIGESQHAFMEGRQLLDTVMATNEVVDDLVASKNEGLICKLSMEKAYNHVSWIFVDYMLDSFGFGLKWRFWKHTCITTTSFVVLINGGPSEFFKASKSLRQGDPLSP